ncbi:MAG: hypothetical protein KGJ09_10230, partial [Candidatus Omnitrophica bacterium]|nr:hypothetical protein [Candidatus Omnitrophota bacterium]MDE2010433.1 hypothetical protein [Candidatus Omnitrophota bacterium]
MCWFSLENLLITIFCLILASFIAKYAENKAHRIWAYFNCAVAFWAFGAFLAGISKTPQQALLYWKLAYLAAVFIPALLYHFVCAYYSKDDQKIIILFLYAQAAVFSFIILFTNSFINDVHWVFNSFYYHRATFCFNIWWALWNITIAFIFYKFRIFLKSERHRQIPSLIIFWSMLIGFLGGASTSFLVYGIMIYPAYHISICLYVLLIAYGIFYHRLLPIDIVIKRSLLYSLLVATISLTYLLSVLISQKLFSHYFGYSSTIIGSIIIAIAFIPLKNKIQDFIDRLFLKASPIEIVQQNEKLRQEVTQTEKFKAIATLAGSIVHEIKNPLTVLQAFSDHLPDRKDDPTFIKNYQTLVPKEITRINTLLQDLLDFAKPSEPKFESIDPRQVIEEVINLTLLKNSHIEIQTKFDPHPIHIQADPQQLKQALLNLVLNAIDAMPNG